MGCTDFVVTGFVEPDGHQNNYSIEAVRSALLSKNPRRNLLQKIVLVSCNMGCSYFKLPSGKTSCAPVDEAAAVPLPDDDTGAELSLSLSTSRDFVLLGGTGVDKEICQELLYSNYSGCNDFVTRDGDSSTPLTNADLLWMERVAEVPPGTIFKAFASKGKLAPSEVSWDPVTRYNMLAKTFREPRGAKSAAHLENLRKSDPLINMSTWIDWQVQYASIKESRAYKVHQHALIKRAMRAHGAQTRAAFPSIDATIMRGERISSDSVMVLEPIGELVDEGDTDSATDSFDGDDDSFSPNGVESNFHMFISGHYKAPSAAAPQQKRPTKNSRRVFFDGVLSDIV